MHSDEMSPLLNGQKKSMPDGLFENFISDQMSPSSHGQMVASTNGLMSASLPEPVRSLLGDPNPSETQRMETLCRGMSGESNPGRAEFLAAPEWSAIMTVDTPRDDYRGDAVLAGPISKNLSTVDGASNARRAEFLSAPELSASVTVDTPRDDRRGEAVLAGPFSNNLSTVDGALNAGTVFVPLSQKSLRDFAVGGGSQLDTQKSQGSPTQDMIIESPENGFHPEIIVGRGSLPSHFSDVHHGSEFTVAACDNVSQASSNEKEFLPTGDSVVENQISVLGDLVQHGHIDVAVLQSENDPMHEPPLPHSHKCRTSTAGGCWSSWPTKKSTSMANGMGDCRVNMLRAGANPPPQIEAPTSEECLIENWQDRASFQGTRGYSGPCPGFRTFYSANSGDAVAVPELPVRGLPRMEWSAF